MKRSASREIPPPQLPRAQRQQQTAAKRKKTTRSASPTRNNITINSKYTHIPFTGETQERLTYKESRVFCFLYILMILASFL